MSNDDPFNLNRFAVDIGAPLAATFPPPPLPPKRERSMTQAERTLRIIREIEQDDQLNAGVKAMMERETEFSSPLAARLAGIAVLPEARERFDAQLDEMWAEELKIGVGASAPREIIVGGGLHAAIYCAVRAFMGHPRPLVIEQDKVGGMFNTSKRPSFYLNSRNRPGDLSIPGRLDGALNVIPCGVVQPSDLSADEYQRNSDLAFAIRATLAFYGRVMTGRKVDAVNPGSVTVDGEVLNCYRVIVATGLGEPRSQVPTIDSPRLVTYPEFLAKMDETFPLRGMTRVAVIGAGDSGKTAIEALTGQGPEMGWSVAGLDYPQTIDWYGVPSNQLDRAGWENCNRSRYKGIGRLLERVNATSERAQYISAGFECAYVNERPYDLVIDCTGFAASTMGYTLDQRAYVVDGRVVSRKAKLGRVHIIGPAAQIELSSGEQGLAPIANIGENATALFRYAGRTAALAAALDRKTEPTEDRQIVGLDENGTTVRVGDIVSISDIRGPVLGRDKRYLDREPAYIVIGDNRGSGQLEDGSGGFLCRINETRLA